MATTLEADAMHDDNDHLRHHLEALPEPPLPDELWIRVAGARRRQVARRRLALGGGAVVALALLALPPRFGMFQLPQPDSPAGSAGDIASADEAPSRAPVASDPDARLRILDRELQAAYRRGSAADEIAQLWEARDALLRERGDTTPVRPVRI